MNEYNEKVGPLMGRVLSILTLVPLVCISTNHAYTKRRMCYDAPSRDGQLARLMLYNN